MRIGRVALLEGRVVDLQDGFDGAGDVAGVAAGEVEEAAHLALRVVEAPGAGPAVGAGIDGAVAVHLSLIHI